TDVSKSTIHHPFDSPSKEHEVRTEHATIDRSGVAARFLRLAFRINMEQLKLASLIAREGEAPAEPLSDDELAEEARQAAADAAELAAARRRADDLAREICSGHTPCAVAPEPHPAEPSPKPEPANPIVTTSPSLPPSVSPSLPPPPVEPSTHHSLSPMHNLHNLHNENAPEIAATAAEPCTCVPPHGSEKNSNAACITGCDQQSKSPRPWAAKIAQARQPAGLVTQGVSD